MKNQKSKIKNVLITIVVFIMIVSLFSITAIVNAQVPTPDTDINSPGFRLVVCDGPVLPSNVPPPKENYVPCDFRGIMLQAQHIINIAIIAGVLVAIGGFCYAGYLFIRGTPSTIEHARKIFSSVAIGFVIMLSAWFIVYQILSWLTGNSGFGTLLGNP